MKMPILSREERVFREPSIFAVDMKAVTLDNVLVNLFMLMRNNGARIKLKLARNATFHDVNTLKEKYFKTLETRQELVGFSDYPEAIESWLRSSLVNMVFRGKAKENISSMRPLHLESYRIRNQKYTRDYNTADQIFIMINQRPEVRDALKTYMSIGWDNFSRKLVDNPTLDIDTAGMLHLIKMVDIDPKVVNVIADISPLLKKQADLYCDDVVRLLAYQNSMPRSVFIDYLRILTGFHLALYFHQLVYQLPKMVDAGSAEESEGWSMVVDMTDRLESDISDIACADMQHLLDGMLNYIKASYTIKAVRRMPGASLESMNQIFHRIKNYDASIDAYFQVRLSDVLSNYDKEAKTEEEREDARTYKSELENYLQFEDTALQKYVLCLMNVGASYQLKYGRQFLDNVSMKNTESALMIDGRSRKHQRRGAIGSKLLEVLVQLLVLTPKDGGGFSSNPLSIRQLIKSIRDRYGLISMVVTNPASPILHPTELHINIVHRHTESRRASVAHVQGQEVQPDKLHRYGVANGIIQQEHLHRTIYG